MIKRETRMNINTAAAAAASHQLFSAWWSTVTNWKTEPCAAEKIWNGEKNSFRVKEGRTFSAPKTDWRFIFPPCERLCQRMCGESATLKPAGLTAFQPESCAAADDVKNDSLPICLRKIFKVKSSSFIFPLFSLTSAFYNKIKVSQSPVLPTHAQAVYLRDSAEPSRFWQLPGGGGW